MATAPTRGELEAEHCWEAGDRVPGRPEMTAFRQRLRQHQSRWRAAQGLPIGSQPINPRPGQKSPRAVGSRLPLDFARETGANFVTDGARHAAEVRSSYTEPHQSMDRQGLWADLLSPLALACNLLGDLADDHALADRVVHQWFPDVPGAVRDIRFEHSPGWLDESYLGNLSSFSAAVELDLGDGHRGILGLTVKLGEALKREVPKPTRLNHYRAVADRSRAFHPGALDGLDGALVVTWLEHLLLLSMLQHPDARWRWGRYVVIHPEGNSDVAGACEAYRTLLSDPSTSASTTLEHLLDADALPAATTAALRERYVVG